jgi:DNA-binding response OmpR family regulator
MRAVLSRQPIDLVILDVVLPEEDGLSAIGALRADCPVPVIMVTGKSETVDRIVGLELGADDYVAKPFELRELLARVRSVLRRSKGSSRPEGTGEKSGSFEFGGFRLDIDSQSLFSADGARIHLTLAEFHLLHAFIRNPNRVLTRDQLLAASTRRGWEPFDRSIDVHISHLRRKIEERPDRPQFIRTIRGAGYMFSPTPGRDPAEPV